MNFFPTIQIWDLLQVEDLPYNSYLKIRRDIVSLVDKTFVERRCAPFGYCPPKKIDETHHKFTKEKVA